MATISKVKIANMALSHIGANSSIESFDEESAEAGQIKLWYDYCRIQALEAFDWTFARKRQVLALLEVIESGDPLEHEWAFRYQYPADCLTARRISNPLGFDADAVPYSIETSEANDVKTILTNMEDAVLVYTFDLDQTSLFSSHFVDCLAALIAHRIAFSLTGKRQMAADMLDLYRGLIRVAPAHNANEEVSKPPREADWIRARS